MLNKIHTISIYQTYSFTMKLKTLLFFLLLNIGKIIGQTTVVDIIVNSNNHNTLEAAVIAAGLADDLSGAGPFTVFAPTDAAFAALPAGTVEALLNDPQGLLTEILTYHVAGGNVLSTQLSDGQVITTLNGATVTVTINADGVFINNAKVTVADIQADNGVVHVIDAVLLPPAESNTVVDIIVNSNNHNTLEAAVIAAGLVDALSGAGPFTVFAPTDAAFAALPAGTVEALLNDPQGLLTEILTYHVAGGNVLSTQLSDGQAITTLNGATVTVTINADGVFINDAKVTVADIQADNGVVHVIDAVLLPPVSSNEPEVNALEGIFPVPATDRIYLKDTDSANRPFSIWSIGGQQVLEGTIQEDRSIALPTLPAGIYTVKVYTEKKVLTGKFSKL